MNISSLLNTSDSDDDGRGRTLASSHMSPPKHATSFPGTPLSTIPEQAGYGPIKLAPDDRSMARTTGPAHPGPRRTALRPGGTTDFSDPWEAQRDGKWYASVTHRTRPTDDGDLGLAHRKRSDFESVPRSPHGGRTLASLSEMAHHKSSESQSSLSSYVSMTSETTSSISSIATFNDDISVHPSVLSEASSEDWRLASARETFSKSRSPDMRTDDPLRGSGLDSGGQMGPVGWRQQGPDTESSYDSPDEHAPSEIRSSVPVPTRDAQSHKRAMSAPGTLSRPSPDIASRNADEYQPVHHFSNYSANGNPHSYSARSVPSSSSSPGETPASAVDHSAADGSIPTTSIPVNRDGDTSPQTSQSDGLKCMYTENCDTGAQPRKVITHFFGRNKACTMMIPPEVWVHYCRKHYQRVRYRNFDNFPLVQIDLVRNQVERIQEWSRGNQETGRGRHVKCWSLALRKREQKRLGVPGAEDADESSSIPQWILRSVGDGHSSEQILRIVDRLRAELVDETLEAIPDIEFLPDIVGDLADGMERPSRTRKPPKRKVSQPERHREQHTEPRVTVSANGTTTTGPDKRPRLVHPTPEMLDVRAVNSGSTVASPALMYRQNGAGMPPSHPVHPDDDSFPRHLGGTPGGVWSMDRNHGPGLGVPYPSTSPAGGYGPNQLHGNRMPAPRLPSLSELHSAPPTAHGYGSGESAGAGHQYPPAPPGYGADSSGIPGRRDGGATAPTEWYAPHHPLDHPKQHPPPEYSGSLGSQPTSGFASHRRSISQGPGTSAPTWLPPSLGSHSMPSSGGARMHPYARSGHQHADVPGQTSLAEYRHQSTPTHCHEVPVAEMSSHLAQTPTSQAWAPTQDSGRR